MAFTQFVFGAVQDGTPMMYGVGATAETETPSGVNSATTAAATATQNVCRVSTDTAVYVSFGTAPNAGTDTLRFFLPANAVEYFRVVSGYKGACITP